jgi:hypothetical protein
MWISLALVSHSRYIYDNPMGRRAHLGEGKFSEFMDSVPESLQNDGYWRIKKEHVNKKTGGVVQSVMGYITFESGEGYDALRARIKENFASRQGPATYYAVGCDERKKELKTTGMVKFEFTDKEVDMPEEDQANTLKDTLGTIKRFHKDMNDMNKLHLEKQLMESMMGKKDDDKIDKLIETFKESQDGNGSGDPMSQLMTMKMLMGDDSSKKSDSSNIERLIEKSNDRMERLMEKMAEAQMQQMQQNSRPNDDRVERLLEKFIESQQGSQQENAFQSMMALQSKQQEDRERIRQEELKRQDERDREERKERERREYDDRESREKERKEERERIEAQVKLDRDKFDKQVAEERTRFEQQLQLRREEMKAEQEKSRQVAADQQNMQFKLLEIFRNNKDSSLESTTRIVETLTSAGLRSMETANTAAESIINIAKRAEPPKEKEEGGIGSIIKDVAQVAGPLLGPYAEADAKLKMIQSASNLAGKTAQPSGQPTAAQVQAAQAQKAERIRQARAARAQQAAQTQAAQEQTLQEAGAQAQASQTPTPTQETQGGSSMIAQYLGAYPIVKKALIGNLKRKLGVESYLKFIFELNQPALEGIIANLDHIDLMDEIKQACTEEEAKLIDENEAWFKEFSDVMLQEWQNRDSEDEEEADEEEGEEAEVEEAPKEIPQPTPPKARKSATKASSKK